VIDSWFGPSRSESRAPRPLRAENGKPGAGVGATGRGHGNKRMRRLTDMGVARLPLPINHPDRGKRGGGGGGRVATAMTSSFPPGWAWPLPGCLSVISALAVIPLPQLCPSRPRDGWGNGPVTSPATWPPLRSGPLGGRGGAGSGVGEEGVCAHWASSPGGHPPRLRLLFSSTPSSLCLTFLTRGHRCNTGDGGS
jgi:hypothetical protein